PLVVFDTGGGSSQFTFGRGKDIDERFSVNVGAARFTEHYGLDGAVSEETLSAALEAIAGDLGRLDGRPTPDALVRLRGGGARPPAGDKNPPPHHPPDLHVTNPLPHHIAPPLQAHPPA